MCSKLLTVLVTPVEGVGHVNASIGIAECLRDRGHRIIFVVEESYEGRLISYGFEEEILQIEEAKDKKPGENIATTILQSGLMKSMSSLDKMKVMFEDNSTFTQLIEKKIRIEPQMKAIVEKYNPDVILIDDVFGSPSLIYCGRPWVLIVSTHPLYMIEDEQTPPGGSGYPTDGDKNMWNKFKNVRNECFASSTKLYEEWMIKLGLPAKNKNRCLPIPDSPYLNIYGFPKELDYTDIRPLPDKWIRIDSFTRRGEKDFKIPEILENRDKNTQKLIYLSMGSMGSIDITLMKCLVKILSKSSHKFIVSKGLFGDKYELADNMWGENSVPQTKVLPLVDLVITHGGNNTVTETFSFGKPMIIMPLFGDQFDNAQRVEEKGFGLRLEAYDCTEQILLQSIEKLLNDKELKDRLNAASKRIANSKSIIKATQLIESLVA